MASHYHDVAPDADHRRREIACWAHTKRQRPDLYARALAALTEAERRHILDQLAASRAAPGRRWAA